MRGHRILYFSLNPQHSEQFNCWSQQEKYKEYHVVKLDNDFIIKSAHDLSFIISKQERIDDLYVIVDYLSLFKDHQELENSAKIIRNTILQYPEVDFLFDQSGVDDSWLSGIEFVLEKDRNDQDLSNKVAQGFHIFKNNSICPFFFTTLDYNNLFDGTNLRWAVRKVYYDKLNANKENFKNLQEHRRDNLAYVIDDEPSQSRFNSVALYSSGYRVIPVQTARMLLSLNKFIESCNKTQDILTPKIIVRDFDLQFPDARTIEDYSYGPPCIFYKVPKWDDKWNMTIEDVEFNRIDCYDKMIDYIRDYRYYGDDEEEKNHFPSDNHWDLASDSNDNPFWCKKMRCSQIYTYYISNGHDRMRIDSANRYHPKRINLGDLWLEVPGMQKPISGLYYPFFFNFRNENGNCIIEDNFTSTRYNEEEIKEYEIDKKRSNHNHGVPLDIYDTIMQMQHRAELYYEQEQFVKAAVLAQDIIELLNGFHHQMMIKAYHLKTMAENAIAMDVVGADEQELVLDALLRTEIVKEDIHRMIYPLFKQRGILIQYQRRIKERQLLGHIYSDCRKACHENEYFAVEAVFISAMAQVNDGFTIMDFILDFFVSLKRIVSNFSVSKRNRLK